MLQTSSAEKLSSFFDQFKPLHYKPRTIISHPNDSNSSVFYIRTGFLRVFRISEQGEELTVAILKSKDFFPLTYGMTNSSHVHPYYLETITPLEIWKIHIDQFISYVKSEPEIYKELTERLLISFDSMLTKMEYLVFNNAHTKVANILISCARKFGIQEGSCVQISVPLTHKDIATLVGITRETTSLEMKKLEKQGYISRNGKILTINNIDRLEKEIFSETSKNPLYSTI